jgi:hypothetical protein
VGPGDDDRELIVVPYASCPCTLETPTGDRAEPGTWELVRGTPGDARQTPVAFGDDGVFTADVATLASDGFFARQLGSRAWSRCLVAGDRIPCLVRIPDGAACLAPIRLRLRGFSVAERSDLRVFASDDDGAWPLAVRDAGATAGGDVVELSPLPARTWQLHVRGEAGECPPIFLGARDVPADGLQIDVDHPDVGWLSCRVARDDGVALQTLSVNAVSAAGTLVDLPRIGDCIALTAGEWRLAASCANAAPVSGLPFDIRAGEVTELLVTLPAAHVTQISFRVPAHLATRCGIELRRDGELVAGFENRRNLMLSWGSADGYSWAVFPLQEGPHRLRVAGPGVDLSGEFFVRGPSNGEPVLVDLLPR